MLSCQAVLTAEGVVVKTAGSAAAASSTAANDWVGTLIKNHNSL